MELIKLKGYRTSKDFTRLKKLLDSGHTVVILWVHDTTKNLFSDLARRVPHIDGGVDGDWYSLGSWGYFPTLNSDPFECFCARLGFSYIDPEDTRHETKE